MNDVDILDILKDLHKQATIEKSHYYVGSCINEAIAEIESLRKQVIHNGYVLVPIKPTNEMIDYAVFYTTRDDDDTHYKARGRAAAVYSAMIDVAQQPMKVSK